MTVVFKPAVRWYNPLVLWPVTLLMLRILWMLTKWCLFGPFIVLAWLAKR